MTITIGGETLPNNTLRLSIAEVAAAGLVINSVTGEATSSTSGDIIITVNKACTLHWRIKSNSAPTDKQTEFPNTFVATGQGTYRFNNGGTLVASTLYYVGAWAEDGTTETEIVSQVGFTTPSGGTDTPPSNIRWSNGTTSISISETAAVGATVGQLVVDGTTPITWTETADPDNKFTVSSAGLVTLSAALSFATATSHSLTSQATGVSPPASQALTINVLEDVPPSEGVDYTVATIAAFYSLVNSWPVSGGVVQVPGAVPKVIQLTAPSSEALTTAKKFSHRVTLQGKGTYTAGWDGTNKKPTGGSGADLTGTVTLTNWENFRLYKMVLPQLTFSDTVDITIERCRIFGTPFNGTTAGSAVVGSAYALNFSNTLRTSIINCHLAYAKTAILNMGGGNVDDLVEGCCFDLNRHDCMKWLGTGKIRNIIRNNWWGRTPSQYLGSDPPATAAHMDMVQSQHGTSSDCIFEGNVGLMGTPQNNGNGKMQGLFLEGTSVHTRLTVRQEVYASGYVNGIRLGNTPVGFATVNYFDCLTTSNTTSPPFVLNGVWSGKDFGVVGSHDAGYGGMGSNGVRLDCGNVNQGDFDPSVYTTSGLYTAVTGPSNGFEAFLPPTTADRTHWNTTDPEGPVGAYLTKKRVFSDGLHPGNVGWPVAEPWTRQYNAAAAISSTYTGTYDADGNNV